MQQEETEIMAPPIAPPARGIPLADQLKQRRLERMRMGNRTGEIVSLPSDKEFRVALVPLLEKEYDQCLRAVASMGLPDTVSAARVMDRRERIEVLVRGIRDPENFDLRIFNSVDDLTECLETEDINYLFDTYILMATSISPSVADLTEEQIDFLKQAWQKIIWKDLSGRQLYALNRFISLLTDAQLTVNLPGFTSTT